MRTSWNFLTSRQTIKVTIADVFRSLPTYLTCFKYFSIFFYLNEALSIVYWSRVNDIGKRTAFLNKLHQFLATSSIYSEELFINIEECFRRKFLEGRIFEERDFNRIKIWSDSFNDSVEHQFYSNFDSLYFWNDSI